MSNIEYRRNELCAWVLSSCAKKSRAFQTRLRKNSVLQVKPNLLLKEVIQGKLSSGNNFNRRYIQNNEPKEMICLNRKLTRFESRSRRDWD